ncbi:MAG: hypothetical protein ACI841_001971 [Planctomycetota bacterium]|jgi:hypothetical protein
MLLVRVSTPLARSVKMNTTDENGRFTIVDAQPDGHNWTCARADGFTQSVWHYLECAACSNMEITLIVKHAGMQLSGTVVDGAAPQSLLPTS